MLLNIAPVDFRPISRWLVIVVVLVAGLAACSVRLAPPYDPGIEQETAALHKNVERFFESMLADPSKRPYAQNRDFYVETLATLNNLEVRSRARWSGSGSVSAMLGPPGVRDTLSVKTPNEEAEMFRNLGAITENVRRAHETFGFREENISVYREQYRVAFTAILQYESFLKR